MSIKMTSPQEWIKTIIIIIVMTKPMKMVPMMKKMMQPMNMEPVPTQPTKMAPYIPYTSYWQSSSELLTGDNECQCLRWDTGNESRWRDINNGQDRKLHRRQYYRSNHKIHNSRHGKHSIVHWQHIITCWKKEGASRSQEFKMHCMKAVTMKMKMITQAK